ncbi:MAG TPA: right-handed parallel beta-helix repeat-containing protein, partial [Methylomirabilota bacterium]|nr:right-handed parallel beta-helix repeat-containing protein [Methylomirabilota bacterium]
LQIDGNGAQQSSANPDAVGIFITGADFNVTIEHTFLHDGLNGNLHIRMPGGTGPIGHTARVLDNIVGKSYSSADSTDDLWVSSMWDTVIDGNTVYGAGHIGIIGGSGGDYAVRISNNYVLQTAAFAGIFEDGAANNFLHDVSIFGNTVIGNQLGNGIETGASIRNEVISNNNLNNTLEGIRLLNSQSIVVSGNSVTRSSTQGIEVNNCLDVTITGNSFSSNGRTTGNADITLDSGSARVSISSNTIWSIDAKEYGIWVDSGQTVSNVTISGNTISHTKEAMRILGGSRYSVTGNMIVMNTVAGIHIGDSSNILDSVSVMNNIVSGPSPGTFLGSNYVIVGNIGINPVGVLSSAFSTATLNGVYNVGLCVTCSGTITSARTYIIDGYNLLFYISPNAGG